MHHWDLSHWQLAFPLGLERDRIQPIGMSTGLNEVNHFWLVGDAPPKRDYTYLLALLNGNHGYCKRFEDEMVSVLGSFLWA